MLRRSRCRRWLRAFGASLVAGAGAASSAAAISGVCPDGSIFIVQSAAAIPCRDAKQLEASDVPPLQPGYLPRPYRWEVFQRRSDPNNPYNLVGVAPPGSEPAESGTAAAEVPGVEAPQAAAAAPRSSGLSLGLSEQEIEDLAEIVVLTQALAPATLRTLDGGAPPIALQLAHSAAFEERVQGALGPRDDRRGPVLLFRADAEAPAEFYGNLTFVQGHAAFHPDPSDPRQLGVLAGGLGALAPGDRVLGYAVLPAQVDPTRPLDIYWNDRRITATLRP